MLYSEFAKNTGCRDNAKNHELFNRLELIYMNSDITKEEVYEMGKKLMDNRKTEEEIKLEKEIREEIELNKKQIDYYKSEIAWKEDCIKIDPYDKEWAKDCKRMIRYYKDQIKFHRNRIHELKWVLQ